eukprot:jgi/Chrpa1/1860/Chrysochromulina_OHIO_Genome00011282-RA
MKSRLSNARATASEGEALDLKKSILLFSNSNAGLGNSNNRIKLLQQMVKEGLSATAQLEDQLLPSKADLSRWFPETPASPPTRLLRRAIFGAASVCMHMHLCHVLGQRRAIFGAASVCRSSITGAPSSTRPSFAAPASRRGLEAPGASVAFAAKAPLADVDDDKAEPANTTEAMRAVLSEWMASYSEDEMAFASKAVFIEMRLRQALACSASIGVPNQFRCAIVCDAWERVVPFTGRLESMLKLLWSELLRCLFVDYAPNMVGAGAKAYAARTPFFVEAQRLRRVQEAAAVKMRAWEIQREQELMVVAERNKAINHTLGAWNRALGFSAGTKQDPAIAEQLSVLAGTVPREGAAAGAAGERLPVAIPIAIPGSGLERWRQREEELITALKAGQEREARAEARLGGLQAQLRDSAATGARRVAQLQQEHAAAHAKLQKQLGELRDQLGAAQVESSRAQLLCEVAQATEQSASRAVRRLDARLDAEWERRNALEKLVSEYERRAEQAEREALTERDRKLAAESSAAVAAERAAATVADLKQRLAAALQLGRREAELCDQKLAAATALAATAAKQAQAEAEATKATALAEMQAEMQAETERRLAAQREAVQAQAQTALLHAQLRADQPLGPSTGLALPTATRA